MKRTWFDSVIEGIQEDVEFLAEEMAFDCVNEIRRVMGEGDVSQAELARRIGKSSAYVSRVLNYSPNMTLRSLVVIADALGQRWATPHLVSRQEAAWKPYPIQFPRFRAQQVKYTASVLPSAGRPQQKGASADEQPPCSLAA